MPAPMISPNGPAPDQLLIDTARQYARHVTGQELQHITLALANGTKHTIDISPGVNDWPPESGWGVRGDQGARGSKMFRLTGKPLAVFTALVNAGPVGLTLTELKREVWDDHADDRNAQNTISRLRNLVREALAMSDSEDPVEADGERYRLADC